MILYYTNITYVNKWYTGESYFNNILNSYDYAFGNFSLIDEEKDLELKYLIHVLFSIVFAIIVTNILITKVGEAYSQVRQTRKLVQTQRKIGLIIKAIDYIQLFRVCSEALRCCKKKQSKNLRFFA